MRRRTFVRTTVAGGLLTLGGKTGAVTQDATARFPAPAPLPFREEKSGLKITAIRAVKLVPKRPLPTYEPAVGSWNTSQVEVAHPLSGYPRFKPRRSLFFADDLGPDTVVVETDKGITGFGYGGPGTAFVVERHLPKLLLGEDPFQVERLWDIMWRGTLYYGRKGAVVHAISAVDNALWDIVGKALHKPVYQLLGKVDRQRVPGYCTGNNIEQAAEFGFKKLKLALPYGPADGEKGLDKNEQLVQRARRILGPDGEIMLDCWMALTESYTEQLAARLKPYRVYWMEECLMPDDYVGMGRLNARVDSTRMATGEHEYTRYGFEMLARHKAADIWQPDMKWCGGLTEMRWIDSLARANRTPVIPHGGWRDGAAHFVFSNRNTPWCEMFLPWPGGPKEVYDRFEEENGITRGPEGIYMRPPDRPGFGFELRPV
ncbi:MAG TPA: L-rhamnonate dehydratase [Planctomycetes bacterium]|nr:L-rhamnonate dehydratase [Fuerstiella sp.]HIK95636.1 L-rhamnonate dehydratase [Planctomycetota bacterium]